MSKVYIPSSGPSDWRRFLAHPDKQWRRRFSARTVASSWESADGLPPEVEALFLKSGVHDFREVELLIAIPEHKVPIPPVKGHPSQNDVFALVRTASGKLIAMAVEAKVSEPFGRTFDAWRARASPGKTEREEFLRSRLGIGDGLLGPIRYQLLHRLASALVEAEHFNAGYAALVVHSFSQQDEWIDDFASFLALYGAQARVGNLVKLALPGPLPAYAGWARGDARFLDA